jgi:hypothetical protein
MALLGVWIASIAKIIPSAAKIIPSAWLRATMVSISLIFRSAIFSQVT